MSAVLVVSPASSSAVRSLQSSSAVRSSQSFCRPPQRRHRSPPSQGGRALDIRPPRATPTPGGSSRQFATSLASRSSGVEHEWSALYSDDSIPPAVVVWGRAGRRVGAGGGRACSSRGVLRPPSFLPGRAVDLMGLSLQERGLRRAARRRGRRRSGPRGTSRGHDDRLRPPPRLCFFSAALTLFLSSIFFAFFEIPIFKNVQFRGE